MKDKIMKEIIDFYTMSNESKGLLFKNLENFKEMQDLIDLVLEKRVQVIHIQDNPNPFVKNYNVNKTIESQVEDLMKSPESCVLYPGENIIIELRSNEAIPYSTLAKKASSGRIDLIYFRQEALKRFIESENYITINNGYNYIIITTDEAVEEGLELFIQIRYCAPSRSRINKERAIAITLSELSKLPSKEQMYWQTFEFQNQKKWVVNDGFITTSLNGEFIENVWIYEDILASISQINEMSLNLSGHKIFRKDFSKNKPEEFSPILSPTKKDFNNFIIVFNNMICENINEKFFQDSNLAKNYSVFKDDGKKKRSIQMLEDFIHAVYANTDDTLSNKITAPMYQLRRIRNPIAHKIQEMKTDLKYYDEQEEIVLSIYESLEELKCAIGSHPKNLSYYHSLKNKNAVFY